MSPNAAGNVGASYGPNAGRVPALDSAPGTGCRLLSPFWSSIADGDLDPDCVPSRCRNSETHLRRSNEHHTNRISGESRTAHRIGEVPVAGAHIR